MNWGRKWHVYLDTGKNNLVSFDQSSNSGAIDIKMNESVLEVSLLLR